MPVSRTKFFRFAIITSVALTLGACAQTTVVSQDIYDPSEAQNRRTHAFNKKVDEALLRPASNGYGTVVPPEGRQLVTNLSDHFSLPADILNNLLQGDLKGAFHNSSRFVVNTVFGVGGIGDMATGMDIPRRETDFGETLHVWGMKEGRYVELPVLGPSTSRDTVGTIMDFTLDPLSLLLPRPEKYVGTAAYVGDVMGSRYDLQTTVDALLYESADSYAQARTIYLQNRRYELGIEVESTDIDPFDDPFAQ